MSKVKKNAFIIQKCHFKAERPQTKTVLTLTLSFGRAGFITSCTFTFLDTYNITRTNS